MICISMQLISALSIIRTVRFNITHVHSSAWNASAMFVIDIAAPAAADFVVVEGIALIDAAAATAAAIALAMSIAPVAIAGAAVGVGAGVAVVVATLASSALSLADADRAYKCPNKLVNNTCGRQPN